MVDCQTAVPAVRQTTAAVAGHHIVAVAAGQRTAAVVLECRIAAAEPHMVAAIVDLRTAAEVRNSAVVVAVHIAAAAEPHIPGWRMTAVAGANTAAEPGAAGVHIPDAMGVAAGLVAEDTLPVWH